MSIRSNLCVYNVECDICGNEAEEGFFDFYEAVEWKKDPDNGWISQKRVDGWYDICPKCHK